MGLGGPVSGPIITATRSSSLYGRTITTICFSITGRTPLFAGLFWPGYDDSGYGAYPGGYWSGNLYAEAPPSRHRSRHHRQRTLQPERPANGADACAAQAPAATALPTDRIANAIQPSADQTNLLNDLKDAETKAGDILRAACPSQVPPDSRGPL